MRIVLVIIILAGTLALVFHPDRPLRMRNTALTVVARDGERLAATLSLPRWKPVIGAVVLVHGSGPLTRNEVRGDVRGLVDLGFAVLHYDKRGAGASGGVYSPGSRTPPVQLISALALDAATVFDTLCLRPETSGVSCGFFGASQAAWVIPRASSLCARTPDFHVLLSGPAVGTGVEGHYSAMTSDGTGEPLISDQDTLEQRTFSYSGDPGFDPRPIWDSLHIATLWLLGDRDRSVPTFATVLVIDDLIASGHPEHRVIRYTNAGHDLRDVDSGENVSLWEDLVSWYSAQRTQVRP